MRRDDGEWDLFLSAAVVALTIVFVFFAMLFTPNLTRTLYGEPREVLCVPQATLPGPAWP